MNAVIALIARAHGPLSPRAIDRAGTVIGWSFVVVAVAAASVNDYVSAVASLLGGAYLVVDAYRNRREVWRAVWESAEGQADPVGVLALCEHLYDTPRRDLLLMSRWTPGDEVPPQMVEADRVMGGAS